MRVPMTASVRLCHSACARLERARKLSRTKRRCLSGCGVVISPLYCATFSAAGGPPSMWFKNLTVYRLPADWSLSAAELEEKLSTRTLQPCSPLEMLSRGWVAPSTTGRMLHTVNQQHLIALGVEQKLLPASIIRQETERRAQVLADSQGFPVGRRQMRDLKMRVTEELRARALSRRRTTRAWIDPINGWFVVDSGSLGKAEELIEVLRDLLGSFAVQ